MAQRGQEGGGLPVAVGHFGDEPQAAQRHHVGIGPGLVDKARAARIDAALILYSLRSPPRATSRRSRSPATTVVFEA
jgi:hypothetical protein